MSDLIRVRTRDELVSCLGGDYSNKKLDLRGADLQGADLQHANLYCADLQGADLRHANLQDADLRDANLFSVNLRHADLRLADLRHADLRLADLRLADLRDANLLGANLQYADLQYTYLQYTYLRRADLQGADFQNAKLNWNSHVLLAEILRQASTTACQFALSRFVLAKTDLCWDDFKAEGSFGDLEYLKSWAVGVLMKYEGWEEYLGDAKLDKTI